MTARESASPEARALHAEHFVSKSELNCRARADEGEFASNAPEIHVRDLRCKLGRETIATVRGRGYKPTP